VLAQSCLVLAAACVELWSITGSWLEMGGNSVTAIPDSISALTKLKCVAEVLAVNRL
jgi:hypothetical protein